MPSGAGRAPGAAFGRADDVGDPGEGAPADCGGPGVAAVEVQGLDVAEQSPPAGGAQGGFEQGRVVLVGAAERGRDRYAAPVGQQRPLEPELAPVNRAFAGSLASAGGLVDRPVDAGLGQVEAHDAVIDLHGLGFEVLEHPGLDPFVAAGPHGGV